jgi:hypothetical protein
MPTMKRVVIARASIAIVLVGLLAGAPFTPAFAGQSIDPNLLNPSPYDISPPGAIITCQATGTSVHCTGSVSNNSVGGDGLSCNGVALVVSTSGSGKLDLTYDQTLSVTKIENHWDKGGPGNTISDPATGRSVAWDANYNFHATFPTPGDFSSWIRSFDGRVDSVVLLGGGLLLHDAGTQMLGPDGLIKQGGPWDITTAINTTGSLPALCTALGA